MSRPTARLCWARPGRMLPAMAHARSGFTLVEILISIMIFVVVSGAMIGILLIGTDLFRRGEFSRAANDETVAVVGTIEDDLKHMVPAADGGWCYAEVVTGAGTGWANGDCIIAFLVTNPDPSMIQHDGSYSRLKVAYGCYQGKIQRVAQALTTTPQDPQGQQDIVNFVNAMPANLSNLGGNAVAAPPVVLPNGQLGPPAVTITTVTSGCLYFGAYLLINGNPSYPPPTTPLMSNGTPLGIDWEAPGGTSAMLPPFAGQQAYDTNVPQGIGQANLPMPSVLRLSLVLTGGSRFAPHGQIIADNTSTLRLSGLPALPTGPGTMLRVDAAGGGATEWIGYSAVANSMANGTVITCLPTRNLRRTPTTVHNRGDVVQLGQTYSIVRTLPQ
jgi:prepilin-type N-terminal cleavage/methylation domain-containing protein